MVRHFKSSKTRLLTILTSHIFYFLFTFNTKSQTFRESPTSSNKNFFSHTKYIPWGVNRRSLPQRSPNFKKPKAIEIAIPRYYQPVSNKSFKKVNAKLNNYENRLDFLKLENKEIRELLGTKGTVVEYIHIDSDTKIRNNVRVMRLVLKITSKFGNRKEFYGVMIKLIRPGFDELDTVLKVVRSDSIKDIRYILDLHRGFRLPSNFKRVNLSLKFQFQLSDPCVDPVESSETNKIGDMLSQLGTVSLEPKNRINKQIKLFKSQTNDLVNRYQNARTEIKQSTQHIREATQHIKKPTLKMNKPSQEKEQIIKKIQIKKTPKLELSSIIKKQKTEKPKSYTSLIKSIKKRRVNLNNHVVSLKSPEFQISGKKNFVLKTNLQLIKRPKYYSKKYLGKRYQSKSKVNDHSRKQKSTTYGKKLKLRKYSF